MLLNRFKVHPNETSHVENAPYSEANVQMASRSGGQHPPTSSPQSRGYGAAEMHQVPSQPWFEATSIEWFYKDPNGQIQGPFSSREMGEWNELGYFKEDLLIRRSVDQQFLPLGQVQLRYQANPFRSTRHPPALPAPAPAPPGK